MGAHSDGSLNPLRLLLEELCCDLLRFQGLESKELKPEWLEIEREVDLGTPGSFADIRVSQPGLPPRYVEIKFGYPQPVLLQHMGRKYGARTAALENAQQVTLFLDRQGRPDWQDTIDKLGQMLAGADLTLEVWDEERLMALLRQNFGVDITGISEESLLQVRQAVDRAKGFYAFGGPSLEKYDHTHLRSVLTWHLGFWKIRQLREQHHLTTRQLLPPGSYDKVVVVLADLCSFSSFVRDTHDDSVVRNSLTSFYSKARYEIINRGGMFYQFVGDEAIGLFGVPKQSSEDAANAFRAARGLLSIGNSVAQDWQRQLDRVQELSGVHIGMAQGNLQFLSLRPYSRTHIGAIGDPINIAARLMAAAGAGEMVVGNTTFNEMPDAVKSGFQEMEALEARNVGKVKAWKWKLS